MKKNMFFLLLKRSVSQRIGRTVLASLSVALAVTIITAMAAVTLGIGEKLGSELSAYGANIMVSPSEEVLLDENMLNRIIAVENVSEAEGKIFARGMIGRHSIEVVGLETSRVVERGARLSGELPVKKKEVLAGIDLKRALGLEPGRKIFLDHGERAVEYVVKGIVETGTDDDRAIMMSVQDAHELTGMAGEYSVLLIRGEPGTLDGLVKKMEEIAAGASVKTLRQVASAEESLLKKVQLLMLLVSIVVLFAAVTSVGGTMGATVLERRQEIGIMMAIGATRNKVSLFYMAETLLIGIAGGTTGFLLGYFCAQIISMRAFDSYISVPLYISLLSMFAGLAIPLASAHFPVRNAMKPNPAEILREE